MVSTEKDPYEDLIDAVLFPGAYKTLVGAIQKEPKPYMYFYLTHTEESPEWKLTAADAATIQIGIVQRSLTKERASGIYVCPTNHDVCGLIRQGNFEQYLYGEAKWQQMLITLLYGPDTLATPRCNRFMGIKHLVAAKAPAVAIVGNAVIQP